MTARVWVVDDLKETSVPFASLEEAISQRAKEDLLFEQFGERGARIVWSAG
jgi:hypothetical protein